MPANEGKTSLHSRPEVYSINYLLLSLSCSFGGLRTSSNVDGPSLWSMTMFLNSQSTCTPPVFNKNSSCIQTLCVMTCTTDCVAQENSNFQHACCCGYLGTKIAQAALQVFCHEHTHIIRKEMSVLLFLSRGIVQLQAIRSSASGKWLVTPMNLYQLRCVDSIAPAER